MNRNPRTSNCKGFTRAEVLVLIVVFPIFVFDFWFILEAIIRNLPVSSSGVQTARTIAIAEFQYAGDHENRYPDAADGSAQDIAQILTGRGGGPVYISDPSIFYIKGSRERAYGGWWAPPPATGLRQANISYDFAGNSGSGLDTNTPDTMPVVWSTVGATHAPNLRGAGPVAVTLESSMPFGTAGIAVTYKNNSAKFVHEPAGAPNLCAPSYPGCPSATVLPGGG